MPLTVAGCGEKRQIIKIGGKCETKQFLESLGFIPGEWVSIIAKISGNVIVGIKGSRVAISKEMANKIMV